MRGRLVLPDGSLDGSSHLIAAGSRDERHGLGDQGWERPPSESGNGGRVCWRPGRELDKGHQAVLLAAGRLPNPASLEQVANILGVDISIIHQQAKLLAWRHLVRIVGGNLDLQVLIRGFVREADRVITSTPD